MLQLRAPTQGHFYAQYRHWMNLSKFSFFKCDFSARRNYCTHSFQNEYTMSVMQFFIVLIAVFQLILEFGLAAPHAAVLNDASCLRKASLHIAWAILMLAFGN
jgi:hypothetical protein